MEAGVDDLWTCPRCGARFVTLSHGCGDYTVHGFFEGKPARARALYEALVRVIGELGPFEQVPTKTRIAFMVRVRFAAVNRVRGTALVCHVWLKRRVESPRFTKVELLGRSDWIHHFVLRSDEELDDELREWMREAYDVGKQAHPRVAVRWQREGSPPRAHLRAARKARAETSDHSGRRSHPEDPLRSADREDRRRRRR